MHEEVGSWLRSGVVIADRDSISIGGMPLSRVDFTEPVGQ